MSIDDRPTLSKPDDDPWLWLEEIEGTKALDSPLPSGKR